MTRFAFLLSTCGLLALVAAANAQSPPTGPGDAPSLSFQPKNSDKPVEVSGENGIELFQDQKRVIAHGPNATATQGDTSVSADTLTADYRTKADGSNEVYRVFATGHVVMKSPNQTVTGETAVYDFDKAALVLEGDPVTMTSGNGSVTAHKVLQYWSNEHVAVAEGNAYAVDNKDHKLWGDKLVAFFRDDASGPQMPGQAKPAPKPAPKPVKDKDSKDKGQSDIIYVQGFGHVRMETPNEIILGDRGAYNIDNGMATIDGGVKVTQISKTGGNNQLDGGYAVVNVNGGRSVVYTSAAQAHQTGVVENPRVRALIGPKTTPPPVTPTPAPAAAK